MVWQVIDRKTRKKAALKKVIDAFRKDKDAQKLYREIFYLDQLPPHDNVIQLLDVIKDDQDKDLYIVFELLESDLDAVIRAGIMEEKHMKYVVYQILCCLKHLHNNNLMHRDLKPSNILVTPECLVKVTDFGSVRSIEAGGNFTRDVGTLWYSAPEILLGSKSYGTAVDMWAVGCVLAEMICKKPIFCSGTTMEQIAMILAIVEWPTEEDMKELKCPLSYHSLSYLPKMEPVKLEQLCSDASEEALDFLEKLLVLVPSKRLTVREALEHPFVSEFEKEESKDEANIELDISDSKLQSSNEYKDRIYYYIESHKNLDVKKDEGDNPILEKLKHLKYN